MSPLQGNSPADLEWDAMVIGTGIGGATLGHALARQGQRVLFCERGTSRQPGVAEGDYAERLNTPLTHPVNTMAPHSLLRAGRWPTQLIDKSAKSGRPFIPFIGTGVGGSSALYGMAMERFSAADFQPELNSEPGRSGRPAWPITYDELQPYYAQAEDLYRVRGSADPLRPDTPSLMAAPPLSRTATALSQRLAARGMHPYQLPSACEYVPGCLTCQGFLCPKRCKNDSWQIAVEPAVTQYGATLIDDCEVVRLHSSAHAVTTVECLWNGQPLELHAKQIILAAGAVNTPLLLQRSASTEWPNGLANASGMVGRHLMRHLIDLYVLKADAGALDDNRRKEIAFNDFYRHGTDKLGTVQSFGRLPPPQMIIDALHDDISAAGFGWALPLVKLGSPVLRLFLARMVDRGVTLATIVEDYPNPENRVERSGDGGGGHQTATIHYQVDPAAQRRIALMRRLMKDCLRPASYQLIADASNNQRIAHACGTCRMGNDPGSSVVDKTCRAHGLDNLYIVDGSCFVSSGGTNPSLTIAANALRVAAHLKLTP